MQGEAFIHGMKYEDAQGVVYVFQAVQALHRWRQPADLAA